MKKLEIALGCDGLLGNFTEGVLTVVEEVTGKKFSLVGAPDFTKGLGLSAREVLASLGLSAREAFAVSETLEARRGFVLSLRPYPQARQGVRRLRELGEVFCVTTPWEFNPWWRAERESWLALHFGIDRVCHVMDKAGCLADVFVDGEPSRVREWQAAWPDRTAVLWRTPHNMGEVVPFGAHVIDSWEALYQVVQETARSLGQPPRLTAEVVSCP